MEIKKCARCGSFFETVNDVCNGCIPKDNKDLGKLKGFLNVYRYDVENLTRGEVAYSTGITVRNLNRFLQGNEFKEYNIPESLDNKINNYIIIENTNQNGREKTKKVLQKI